MMYSETETEFEEKLQAFKDKFEKEYDTFYLYFKKQWLTKIELWSKVFRMVSLISLELIKY